MARVLTIAAAALIARFRRLAAPAVDRCAKRPNAYQQPIAAILFIYLTAASYICMSSISCGPLQNELGATVLCRARHAFACEDAGACISSAWQHIPISLARLAFTSEGVEPGTDSVAAVVAQPADNLASREYHQKILSSMLFCTR